MIRKNPLLPMLLIFLCLIAMVKLVDLAEQDELEEATRINNRLSQSFELLMENTDIMMRFSHYTDKHVGTHVGCPECNYKPSILPDVVHHDPLEDNVIEDPDVAGGFSRMEFSLLNNRMALQHTLQRLREEAAE